MVVTKTGGADYSWQADVPAGGGTITIVGTVDPGIVTDTLVTNNA